MDKVLLGILMLKRMTIYEMRSIIKQNFQAMCSDSLGSIQAAIKKLLAANMISCNEFVEKSINKKVYSITDCGREVFVNWIKTPMDMGKSKNMELGKLLFMGLVPKAERLYLIDEVITILRNELDYLINIQENGKDSNKIINQSLEYLENDLEYSIGIQNTTNDLDILESIQAIALFEKTTLQLGIDTTKFHIDWFESLKKSL